MQLPFLDFHQSVSLSSGAVQEYPLKASWKGWEIAVFAPHKLELTGSLHKYYQGCNSGEFPLSQVKKAIEQLGRELKLDPENACVVNLEFGLNVSPACLSSEVLRQVLCYRNILPMRPFTNNKKGCLLDFPCAEYYVKIYNKGLQKRKGNLLRYEIKGITSRYFQNIGIHTLSDLATSKAAKALERKLMQSFKEVVFTDDTLDKKALSAKEKELYLRMKDAKEWANNKGSKTSTLRRKELRFKALVREYGDRNLYSDLPTQIAAKWQELITG